MRYSTICRWEEMGIWIKYVLPGYVFIRGRNRIPKHTSIIGRLPSISRRLEIKFRSMHWRLYLLIGLTLLFMVIITLIWYIYRNHNIYTSYWIPQFNICFPNEARYDFSNNSPIYTPIKSHGGPSFFLKSQIALYDKHLALPPHRHTVYLIYF